MEPHPFELRWHLCIQGPDPDPKGSRKINEMLDNIQSGWCWWPSDDTIEHPALYRRLGETIAANPTAGAIVVSQHRGGGHVLHARPDAMKVCHVDGAQVIWDRAFIGSERHQEKHGGTADGNFIVNKWREAPERFVFLDEVLTNWNSLDWCPDRPAQLGIVR
jgi:hypothetical protein